MKVIDLLNKMANNVNYKPSFKFRDCTYKYNVKTKYYEPSFMGLYKLYMILNDEVEIIEEDKDIEELNLMFPISNGIKNTELGGFVSIYNSNLTNIKYKIDEIIDELNKLKNK